MKKLIVWLLVRILSRLRVTAASCPAVGFSLSVKPVIAL